MVPVLMWQRHPGSSEETRITEPLPQKFFSHEGRTGESISIILMGLDLINIKNIWMGKSIKSQKTKHNMEVNLWNSQADLGLRGMKSIIIWDLPSWHGHSVLTGPHSQAGLQSVAMGCVFLWRWLLFKHPWCLSHSSHHGDSGTLICPFSLPQLTRRNPGRPEQPLERKPLHRAWSLQESFFGLKSFFVSESRTHPKSTDTNSGISLFCVVACRLCVACFPNFLLSFFSILFGSFPCCMNSWSS